jgi:hypothetical protein
LGFQREVLLIFNLSLGEEIDENEQETYGISLPSSETIKNVSIKGTNYLSKTEIVSETRSVPGKLVPLMVCERGCTFNTSCPFGAVTKVTGIVSPMMIFSANEILSPETVTAGKKKRQSKIIFENK